MAGNRQIYAVSFYFFFNLYLCSTVHDPIKALESEENLNYKKGGAVQERWRTVPCRLLSLS